MAELIDSAKDTCSTYNFFRGACRLTNAAAAALAAKRAYKLFMQRRNGPATRPPPPPRPPQPPSTSSSNNSQQAQSPNRNAASALTGRSRIVLVDCGHALCKQCAASVPSARSAPKPKLGRRPCRCTCLDDFWRYFEIY
uniref:RING-type domain-containing protein n=1 Tax=Macrostomum lignano TaxID=282301 RepID=A0A1I8FRV9_9PLAT